MGEDNRVRLPLALVNLAIDSNLRACDFAALKVCDELHDIDDALEMSEQSGLENTSTDKKIRGHKPPDLEITLNSMGCLGRFASRRNRLFSCLSRWS